MENPSEQSEVVGSAADASELNQDDIGALQAEGAGVAATASTKGLRGAGETASDSVSGLSDAELAEALRASPAAEGMPSSELRAFDPPEVGAPPAPMDARRVRMLSDVSLPVRIELGRTRMLVEDVLKLGDGSVVELDKLAGDPVDVYVNDRLVVRGEVLVLNDNFCVRVSDVLSHDPHRVVQ